MTNILGTGRAVALKANGASGVDVDQTHLEVQQEEESQRKCIQPAYNAKQDARRQADSTISVLLGVPNGTCVSFTVHNYS